MTTDPQEELKAATRAYVAAEDRVREINAPATEPLSPHREIPIVRIDWSALDKALVEAQRARLRYAAALEACGHDVPHALLAGIDPEDLEP